jgi:hypothetical protein
MRQWISGLLGLALAITQLPGCQKRATFNPALAGRFFPLRAGFNWIYQVAYANGARETIEDRVVRADQTGTSRAGVLVISDYSFVDGSRAVSTDLAQTYPTEMTEVQTRYVVEGGFITRVQNLGEPSWIRLEEHRFLPQYLWPDRTWSNTLSPFEDLPKQMLTVKQNHRTFLEEQDVVVPAGRFAACIRVETEASYQSPAGSGKQRFFTDWYAPDIGLVQTVVLSGGQNGREIARIELLRFAKSKATARARLSNGRSHGSSVIGEKAVIVDP